MKRLNYFTAATRLDEMSKEFFIFELARFKNETTLSERSFYLTTLYIISHFSRITQNPFRIEFVQFTCCSYCKLHITCGGKCRPSRSVFRIEVMGRSGGTRVRRGCFVVSLPELNARIGHGQMQAPSPIRDGIS